MAYTNDKKHCKKCGGHFDLNHVVWEKGYYMQTHADGTREHKTRLNIHLCRTKYEEEGNFINASNSYTQDKNNKG